MKPSKQEPTSLTEYHKTLVDAGHSKELADDVVEGLKDSPLHQPSKLDDLIDAVINFKEASVDFAAEAELFGDNEAVLRTANVKLDHLKAKARAEIKALLEEVIGSDELAGGYGAEAIRNMYRNQLRAEQRLRKDAL